MPLELVTNTGPLERTWGNLVNASTHRTLRLAPGESAEVDVPEGFTDQYLTPAKAPKARAPKAKADDDAPKDDSADTPPATDVPTNDLPVASEETPA